MEALERLRGLCLGMPEATERLSHGEPTWFVRDKKVFVMFANQHHVLGVIIAKHGDRPKTVGRNRLEHLRPGIPIALALHRKPDCRAIPIREELQFLQPLIETVGRQTRHGIVLVQRILSGGFQALLDFCQRSIRIYGVEQEHAASRLTALLERLIDGHRIIIRVAIGNTGDAHRVIIEHQFP